MRATYQPWSLSIFKISATFIVSPQSTVNPSRRRDDSNIVFAVMSFVILLKLHVHNPGKTTATFLRSQRVSRRKCISLCGKMRSCMRRVRPGIRTLMSHAVTDALSDAVLLRSLDRAFRYDESSARGRRVTRGAGRRAPGACARGKFEVWRNAPCALGLARTAETLRVECERSCCGHGNGASASLPHRRSLSLTEPKAPIECTGPQRILWAMTALWVAYGLTFIHAVVVIGIPSTLWPPEYVVANQLVFELASAALIYFVSSGRYWARLIYAVWLGARTLNVIRKHACGLAEFLRVGAHDRRFLCLSVRGDVLVVHRARALMVRGAPG